MFYINKILNSNSLPFNFKIILIGCFLGSALMLSAQITLPQVLSEARTNAPLHSLLDLTARKVQLRRNNIDKEWLPQIGITGQASYQSEVTTIGAQLPGVEIEPLAKDQYKLQLELNQKLYDAGISKGKKKLTSLKSHLDNIQTKLKLEDIREQAIHLFFKILELDENLKILDLTKEDLNASYRMIQSAIENGTVLEMEGQQILAAIVKLDQQYIELSAARSIQINTLNRLTKLELNDASSFQKPEQVAFTNGISDTKLDDLSFALQNNLLEEEHQLNKMALKPQLQLFAHGGYGRPGLNFLKNEFDAYYIAGVRGLWNFGKLYTQSNDNELLALGKSKIKSMQEVSTLNTHIRMDQYKQDISKLEQLIQKDKELIGLRNEITETAKIQLENGIINSTDYLTLFNEEQRVMQILAIRELHLLKMHYLLSHEGGNYTIEPRNN